jgi:hypothetical protein
MPREKRSAREWINAVCVALIGYWKTSLISSRSAFRASFVFGHRFGRAEKPRNGDTTLAMNSQQAHDLAEASFKKKEPQGQKVNAADDADRLAVREKTARLRALRLSRDAAGTTLVKNTPIKNTPILSGKKCPSDPS